MSISLLIYSLFIYIGVNFIASLLGPSTVLIMIADSLQNAYDVNLWLAYFIAMAPTVLFCLICFSMKSDRQIQVAGEWALFVRGG